MGYPVTRSARVAALGAWLLLAFACGQGGTGSAAGTVDTATAAGSSGTTGATPVTMARVTRATLPVLVNGPGHTDTPLDERIRAPFQGTLVALSVAVGDQVRAGQVVGAIVAQSSEAALEGARALVRDARTPAQRQDAQRALTIAEHGVVRTPLRAVHRGVVIARAAAPGEIVNAGDSIVSIAQTGKMVFFADVAQSELAQVHATQRATIDLIERPSPISGVVHAVLPADTSAGMNLRVRIDLQPASPPVTVGLFGTAHIVVAEHTNVLVVPHAALLRNDVTGVTRMATVTSANRAHWVEVKPGISDTSRVEIVAPSLPVGTRVITSGQVGLPEGARVVAGATRGDTGAASPAGTAEPAAGAAPAPRPSRPSSPRGRATSSSAASPSPPPTATRASKHHGPR